MDLLRVIFLSIILIVSITVKADSTEVNKFQIGASISKPIEILKTGSFKNELLFRYNLMNNYRLQFGTGYERLNGLISPNLLNDFTEGAYVRIGLQKTFVFPFLNKKAKRNFYVGFNILHTRFNHSFDIKPNAQMVDEFYLHKQAKDQINSIESELGILLFKRKRLSIESIQRYGVLLNQPKYKYYLEYAPGITKYNFNRLYFGIASISLFYKF